ncbi:MAG: class I SAM-dependent methyltransferase [Pirellulales bacterium]|nr:class I SAM-dependent methyltransferase [Pirellulales bacterium]
MVNPLPNTHLPEWRLPPGVPAGVWEYAQADHIAQEYDDDFALTQLFEFDEQVVANELPRAGWVVDLGCGTGRALVPLARRGFRCLAVDLSRPMLQVVGQKAEIEGLTIHRVQANLVQLGCLANDCADYALCLFSTLGMIRGREHRRETLRHVRRILKPGGRFILHVHNVWYNLFNPQGRRWLARHWAARLVGRRCDPGDKFFAYRGIPRMYLHTFSQRELVSDLRRAGLRIERLIRLAADRQRPLSRAWLLGRFRANGWIAVCGK